MAKGKLKDVVPKLVALLESVEAEERGRAIQAAFLTLGEGAVQLPSGLGTGGGGGVGAGAPGGQMTAQAYFKAKQPKNKIEELAVAARYREQRENAEISSKADIQNVVIKARLNFDANNFRRDIDNAKKAKLFNIGGGNDAHMLSAYGQDYVDTLPNRDGLKALSSGKKKRGGAKKKGK